jgi:hypothetical protein
MTREIAQTQQAIAAGAIVVTLEADDAGDDDWFARHPQKKERRRPATRAELQLSGHPTGTMVVIKLLAPGLKARVFPNRRSQRN